MSSSRDLVSGDALFQELRQFFDQAARNPVNKEGGSASGSGDTSAHWQVVYSVCRTTFASHTVEDLWLHTSQVLDSLILEIEVRPAILLHRPTHAQVIPLASSPGQHQQHASEEAPHAAAPMLAPWLAAHLLRALALFQAGPSSVRMSLRDQQETLEKVKSAIVKTIQSISTHFCLEDEEALDLVQPLVASLFVLAQELGQAPSTGLTFSFSDLFPPSLARHTSSCALSLSAPEAKALEPALLDILCTLVTTTDVASAHAPECMNLLQRYAQRQHFVLARGKSKQADGLANLCAAVHLAQTMVQAHASPSALLPFACVTSAVLTFSDVLEASLNMGDRDEDEGENADAEAVHLLESELVAFIQLIKSGSSDSTLPLSTLSGSFEKLVGLAISDDISLAQQKMLSGFLELDQTSNMLSSHLAPGRLGQLIGAVEADQGSLLDLKQRLDLLHQHQRRLTQLAAAAAEAANEEPLTHPLSTSVRKRKRSEAERAGMSSGGHKTNPSEARPATGWRAQVETLLNSAAPDMPPWTSSESLDTVLVRVVHRISQTSTEQERQPLFRLIGLTACAKDGTLDWSLATDVRQAFCRFCDEEHASSDAASLSTPVKPGRNMKGIALAALLKLQDSTHPTLQSTGDILSALKTYTRLLRHSKASAHVLEDKKEKKDPIRMLATFLDHEDRLIRISSGRALAAIQQVLSQECREHAPEGYTLAPAMRKFEGCLRKSRALRETALIGLGRMGRSALDDQLSDILQLMVSQLGRQGDPVASVAYAQLVNLAKHRNTSPYKLFAPFLPTLSPFIIQQNSSSMLDAFAELTGVSRHIFFKQNATYIAPVLILQGRRPSIEHLAAACEMSLPELIAHNAARIISTLQLTNSEASRQGTQFMLGLFNPPQTLKGIFQSCAAEVLFELVVEWGDASATSDLALGALEKFVKLRLTSANSVEELLGTQLLGVLALMNDFLNDLHGRRSTAQKRKALNGLGKLIARVGVAISDVTPQVMATLQSSLAVPTLRLPTLGAWYAFITSLKFDDVGPFVGQTSAALIRVYAVLRPDEQAACRNILEYLVRHSQHLGAFADDFADLSAVPALAPLSRIFKATHPDQSFEHNLRSVVQRIDSDNESVCLRGLCDLARILERDLPQMREFAAGDTFDPLLGKVTKSVIASAIRSGDAWPDVRAMAFECLGSLGALDPDRLEIPPDQATFVLQNNFSDSIEAMEFAVDFIQHVLVRAYQSSNDTKHQAALAYSIQQLLKFCQFGPALLTSDASKQASIPLQIMNRWKSLPKPVIETVAPLLTSRFEVKISASTAPVSYPLYQHKLAYRDWLRDWTLDMIGLVSDANAKAIFSSFLSVVKTGDVGVARRLVPHLVLHLVLSEKNQANIKTEILEVLQDQTRPVPRLASESRLLCAQVVFDAMDHLGQWLRRKTAELAKRRHKYRKNPEAAAQANARIKEVLKPVKTLLASIPQELQAQAALRCRSYARALLNFERRLTDLRQLSSTDPKVLNDQFERLHEIYAEIEEPDGMEGISTQIIDPSTMHRIREHESTGRWTSAQSCWEVELQNSPDNLDYHTGLLKCLRNLGHYDSLKTHIVGVLHGHPEWRSALAPFELEGSLILGDWDNVAAALSVANPKDPATIFASVTQALQVSDPKNTEGIFNYAREQLGSEIVAAGQESYRRVYDAVTNLHILNELELIHQHFYLPENESEAARKKDALQDRLDGRLNALSPAFRIQEQVLSMRRTAFRLVDERDPRIGPLWLKTAKVARKSNHPQTSYSATLQAERAQDACSFLQRVKLEKTVGLSTRALQELDRELLPLMHTASDRLSDIFLAKSFLTKARWMVEADRYQSNDIIKAFTAASQYNKKWESPWYYLAQYYQEMLQRIYPDGTVEDYSPEARQYQYHTVKCLVSCLTLGSKYIYQAMPRWLTVFMDFGTHKELLRAQRAKRKSESRTTSLPSNDAAAVIQDFRRLAQCATRALDQFPSWQWLTVFPQVVSRICHPNEDVYRFLDTVMVNILRTYPHHAVWQMGAVVHSTMSRRAKRCTAIFEKAKSGASRESAKIITAGEAMVKQMLHLANYKVRDNQELRMSTHFPGLQNLAPSPLIVPLQSSLTVTLPSTVADRTEHKPFPLDLPIIARFDEQIDVMSSLAKPRKVVMYDHSGAQYSFLCKPHDDLRKDARLMEFNSMINKLLKKDSESRRRRLVIRTYCVLPLNEECGLIEWVPNTVAFRSIMSKLWDARGIQQWTPEVRQAFDNIRKPSKDPQDTIGRRFEEQILSKYPPVFREWFIETFPEPSTWLRNRMAYSRTAAVMSMVGFVLGLGDRHGENILFDSTTGDTVHVDFNCLFDKGRTFEIMERVPFRLTQNMVDGFGITGVEGAFRRSCEITMRVLRASQDSLMSVLEAFVHDPLVEWGGKKKKGSGGSTGDEAATDEARKALVPIRRKLQGFQSSADPTNLLTYATTTENQVQNLIQEATSSENLGAMYIGWAAFM